MTNFHASHAEEALSGLVWPAIDPAIPLRSLLQSLQAIETVSHEALRAGQQRQFSVLVQHLLAHAPSFRARLLKAGLSPETFGLDDLPRLPPLSRRDLQAAGESLFSTFVPSTHHPVTEAKTSGSSGEPVRVRRTAISQLFWLAYTMREHLWWQRDFSGTFVAIRASVEAPQISLPDWGPPASLLIRTGPAYGLSLSLDTAAQLSAVRELSPQYLLTYPNVLADLLRHVRRDGRGIQGLSQIRTLGETVTDALRKEAHEVLGVEIVDCYSSQEVGIIAIQCPTGPGYHVMAENLLVEVLNPDGQPCQPGEIGAVVVTDLHNLATPLVRYALGDYAEVGWPCACGRTLPTLRRIMGRIRHMVCYPDGTSRWAHVNLDRYRDVAPVIQCQLAQISVRDIEVRLVAERPLIPCEQQALGELIASSLGYPFTLTYRYFTGQLPGCVAGKFQEFVCEIPGMTDVI